MELKDYLHYYLGCRVDKDPMALDYPTIKGIHGDRVMISEYRYKTPHADGIFTRPEMYQYSGFIKPLLRRLEDMTEGEAEKLAMIYSGAKSVERTKGVASNWHYYFCYFSDDEEGEVLIIGGDGCAWYAHYFDKGQPGYRNIVNEHQAFHYLIQQGFDLFGLIPAGLAIDAKTVTP